jgi:hypothetical protein
MVYDFGKFVFGTNVALKGDDIAVSLAEASALQGF